MTYNSIVVNGRSIKLKPLSQKAWMALKKEYKGDDDATRLALLIEAMSVSASLAGEGSKDELRELFESLPISELAGTLGVKAMAIMMNDPEEMIALKVKRAELSEQLEKRKLEAEIAKLEKELGELNAQA